MLEVNLLGQFEVLHNGRRLTIPTRNAQALLAYLIMNAGKAHRREKLAGLLWPDSDEGNSRSNLRHELWRLRKALETEGESYFLVDDLTIAFNSLSAFSLDVQRLENASLESSSTEQLFEALAAYRGELLPGFYDEWVFIERDRLHALYEAKMARLLDILQQEQRWVEVQEWAIRWIGIGGWPEPAYRALMLAHANHGDVSKAIAAYERLTQGLKKDLEVKPSEETQTLYKRIKTGWKKEVQGRGENPESQSLKSPLEIPSTILTVQNKRLSNLPRPMTSFIGREKEIRQVEQLVCDARLVTITGPGGVGKTRLAIQAAGALLPDFRDGVCWVELASIPRCTPPITNRLRRSYKRSSRNLQALNGELTEVHRVAQAVVKALRIQESPGVPPQEGVVEYLHDKQLLLILDNCEHLIEGCAALVQHLLDDCSEMNILTTSREALGVAGEKAWLLPSLSLFEPGLSLDLDTLFQSEAASLFVDRATDILHNYQPGEVEVPMIARICEQLDGIPLAIELAAARMNLLSVQEIAKRLDSRFSLLTGGRRTALPRHQTLQAAIEWSYDLLSEPERVLFRRLSIFTGSFTLEAAEAVCAGKELHRDELLSIMGRLVEKSLLQVVTPLLELEMPTRYRYLDTIRSFGRIKLDDVEETQWLQDRQATYYVDLVQAAEPELVGPKQRIWLTRLKDEYSNLQAVLQWTLDMQDSQRALELVGSLWRYWWMRGEHSEGRDWFVKALSTPGPQPEPVQGSEWLERALSLTGYQQPSLRAKALNGAGILARGQGDFEKAAAYLNECLEIYVDLADKNGIANVQNSLGILAQIQGNYAEAIRHHQENLRYRREIGDKRGSAVSLHNLSMIYQERREYAQAETLLNESLALVREVNDTRSIAATQLSLGYIMYETGNDIRAEEFFRRSLVIFKDLEGRNDIIEALEGFAGVAALRKQPQRGALLLAITQALRKDIGIPVARYHQIRYQHIVESITDQLDSQKSGFGDGESNLMSMEDAIEYALYEAG